MSDRHFTPKNGFVNSHQFEGTEWVFTSNGYYFDSYGVPPPKLRNFFSD